MKVIELAGLAVAEAQAAAKNASAQYTEAMTLADPERLAGTVNHPRYGWIRERIEETVRQMGQNMAGLFQELENACEMADWTGRTNDFNGAVRVWDAAASARKIAAKIDYALLLIQENTDELLGTETAAA
jgi:prophage DNA circulation protein